MLFPEISRLRFLICCCLLGLTFGGCAAEPTPPPRPVLELETFYYIGVKELHLKSQPDAAAADTATVKLNERVKSLKRQGSWFRVQTAAGREGWANERDLKLDPVSDFFVGRWGVRLREAPEGRARTVARLRLNDRVKLLELSDQGWARVNVSRTQETGWLEMQYLSTDRVVVRRRVRKPGPAEAAPAENGGPPEAPPVEPDAPAPAVTPAPAEAAPPPPTPKAPGPRRQRPELFEPF